MWKEQFSIGVDHIDEQHKSLFAKTVELTNLVKDGVEKNRAAIIDIIVFLKGYALEHFRAEEAYQKSIGYAGFEEHQSQHKAFIKTVLKHERSLTESGFAEAEVQNFTKTLTEWLSFHVANSDQKIVGKSPVAV